MSSERLDGKLLHSLSYINRFIDEQHDPFEGNEKFFVRENKNIIEQSIIDEKEDSQYYLSGLFNIELSPAFKFLDTFKNSKDMSEER